MATEYEKELEKLERQYDDQKQAEQKERDNVASWVTGKEGKDNG